MDTREYLIAKGHSPEAIVCNDWNLLNSDFDLEEMLEDYYQTKLKNLSQHIVSKRPTEIKDRNGKMIHFGDTMIFADKLEWYKGDYFVDILAGRMTGEEAKQKIEEKPYETRKVESVEDYEWLLSSEIQSWWEVVC